MTDEELAARLAEGAGRLLLELRHSKFLEGNTLGIVADKVANAWVASHGALPLIGPRTLPQLLSNLGAMDLVLSAQQLARLDAASALRAEESGAALAPVA